MFDHTNDVVGSKMAREMVCFTIETGVVGREGRICEMLQIARRLIMGDSRWSWVADGGAVLLGIATADG